MNCKEVALQILSETSIHVNDIHDSQGVLDHDRVDHYHKKIKNGEHVNRIILKPLNKRDQKKHGKKYHIYDGSHRYNAHLKAGKSHVDSYVADSDDDADHEQMRQHGR